MIMQRRIKHVLYGIAVLLLIVAGTGSAKAQSVFDLRFNEILVLNDSSTVDDYGQHSSWIEIYNSAYNSVNLGGCYLTDDLSNPTKFLIPKGNPKTVVPYNQFIVFYADSQPTKGIFHLNFNLRNAKTIALFDPSGTKKIDQLDIPQTQQVNITYGKKIESAQEWDFLALTTPGATNDPSPRITEGEKFVKMDPFGIGMTMIAMFVVFSALAILYIIYKNLGRFFIRRGAAASKPSSGETKTEPKQDEDGMSGEVNAAIAMALYLYQNETHDYENTVLTINKVSKNYSPWSSKIYTLRKLPR